MHSAPLYAEQVPEFGQPASASRIVRSLPSTQPSPLRSAAQLGASEKVVENVRVERYRPGQAPKWAEGDEDAEAGFVPTGAASASDAPPPTAVDRRLQRLAESSRASGASERRRCRAEVIDEEEDAAPRRRIAAEDLAAQKKMANSGPIKEALAARERDA